MVHTSDTLNNAELSTAKELQDCQLVYISIDRSEVRSRQRPAGENMVGVRSYPCVKYDAALEVRAKAAGNDGDMYIWLKES